jgi:hypothetical protein
MTKDSTNKIDLIHTTRHQELATSKDPTSIAKYALIDLTAGIITSFAKASTNNKQVSDSFDIGMIVWKDLSIESAQNFLNHYSDKKVKLSSLAAGAFISIFSKKEEEKFEKVKDDLIYDIFTALFSEKYRDWITYLNYENAQKSLEKINDEYIIQAIYPTLKKGKTPPEWTLFLEEQGITQDIIKEIVPTVKHLILSLLAKPDLLEDFIFETKLTDNLLLNEYFLELINQPEVNDSIKKYFTKDVLTSLYMQVKPIKDLIDSSFETKKDLSQQQLNELFLSLENLSLLMLNNLPDFKDLVSKIDPSTEILAQLKKEETLSEIIDLVINNNLSKKIGSLSEDTILLIISAPIIKKTLMEALKVNEEQLIKIVKSSLPDIKTIIELINHDPTLKTKVKNIILDYVKNGSINKNLISEFIQQASSTENNHILSKLTLNFIPDFLKSTKQKISAPLKQEENYALAHQILVHVIQQSSDPELNKKYMNLLSYDFEQPLKDLFEQADFKKDLTILITDPKFLSTISEKFHHLIKEALSSDNNLQALAKLSETQYFESLGKLLEKKDYKAIAELLEIKDYKSLAESLEKKDYHALAEFLENKYLESFKIISQNTTDLILDLVQQTSTKKLLPSLGQIAILSNFDTKNIAVNLKQNDELRNQSLAMLASNDFRDTLSYLEKSQELSNILSSPVVKLYICNFMNINEDIYDIFLQDGFSQLHAVSKLLENDIIRENISNIYKNYNSKMTVLDMLLDTEIRSSVLTILKQEDFYSFLLNSSNDIISAISSPTQKNQISHDNMEMKNNLNSIVATLKGLFTKYSPETTDKTLSFLPKNLASLKNKDLNFVQKIFTIVKICIFCIKEFGVKQTINLIGTGIKSKKVKKSFKTNFKNVNFTHEDETKKKVALHGYTKITPKPTSTRSK